MMGKEGKKEEGGPGPRLPVFHVAERYDIFKSFSQKIGEKGGKGAENSTVLRRGKRRRKEKSSCFTSHNF